MTEKWCRPVICDLVCVVVPGSSVRVRRRCIRIPACCGNTPRRGTSSSPRSDGTAVRAVQETLYSPPARARIYWKHHSLIACCTNQNRRPVGALNKTPAVIPSPMWNCWRVCKIFKTFANYAIKYSLSILRCKNKLYNYIFTMIERGCSINRSDV